MKTKGLKIFLGIIVGLLCAVTSVYGRTRTVGVSGTGSAYTNLVDAVNAAQTGDTLMLLSDVTLDENLSFSKSVVVMSKNGYAIKRKSVSIIWDLIHLYNTSIYINGGIEVVFSDIVLDANNLSSTSGWVTYNHYVSVNSGAVLRLNRTVIRNSTDGAPLAVSGTVVGGLVTGNTSSESAMGVVLVNSNGLLVNMVIVSNTLSKSNVSAVNLNGGDMLNCTVINNRNSTGSANRYGINSSNSKCKVTNCIVYGNGGSILNVADVTYSCIQGGYTGRGNISANPLLNGDYTLMEGSPCVDAGSNSAISGVTDIDYFGKPRIGGPAVDMGASEKPRNYCERTDTHVSCGEPFVWIDGKTYTESNHTALDTVLGYGDCDTIVTLDFTYYPPVDKSSLTEEDLNKIDCTGEEVTFSFDPSASGRTSFRWMNPSGGVVSTSTSYTATVGTHDVEYLFVASAPDGSCPDSTLFMALLNYDFFVQNQANSSVDSAANNDCLLKSLDLNDYKPTISYCSNLGKDTTYRYRLNNGPWVDFESAPVLSDVASGDEIRWSVSVRTYEGDIMEDVTPDPIVVHLWDDQRPVLSCDGISAGKRVVAVADSVSGVVPCPVTLQDVLSSASDNCTSSLKVYVSLDGATFYEFNGYEGYLNVFEAPSATAYWFVEDNAGLRSDVCPVTYEVERATLRDGEYYAIVRDTSVCSLPVSWHGHTFTSDGEQAKVGAALLTVRIDSSYYKTETVVNVGPYTWRDGITYTKSTEVNDFHQPNAGTCDSVFSLRLTIKETSDIKIDEPLSPIDSVMNDGCFLSRLDLEPLKPGFVYNLGNALDTTVYYRVNGGDWVDYAANPILSKVENGTKLYWRVVVTADDHSSVFDETSTPQLIRLSDVVAPSLDCKKISVDKRMVPVLDSVKGDVQLRVYPAEVKLAASDNCSTDFTVFVSTDGLSFSKYNAVGSFPLNVFTQPTITLYWNVSDEAGNESSVCSIEYGVERNTEVASKKYAIVRDTMLCVGELPFVWHGYTFTYSGEQAEVGAALLTVHVDSSFYVEESVMSMEPYTWRNGVTYTESVRVEDYHQPNAGKCDSVFTLNLVMKTNLSLVVYEAMSPIDSVANEGCNLRRMDMASIRPAFAYSSDNAIDTSVYYRVNRGEWVSLADQPSLLNVADGTELHWKVVINTQDTSLSDETVNPQLIRVRNLTAPYLACDDISAGKRFAAVIDSVNGEARFSVSPSDVSSAASSECASSFDVLYSNDGVNFNPYNGLTFNLNAFTQTERTLYWKVTDEVGNISEACAVDYSVERATEKDGKMYAIVRDTFVCATSFPVTWHGHVFNAAGESAEIGAALLSVRIDSSYYRYDTLTICNVRNYQWRDGKTYNSGSSYDLSYTVDNGPDLCDSIVYVHLSVFNKVDKPVADTVYSVGCYGDFFRMGYTPSGVHTEYAWYEQGVLQHGEDWDGRTRVTREYSGHDNYQYMLVTSVKGGYCPDTTVYVTNSTHDIESGDVKSLVMFAGDNCKARVRLRDYMPDFIDRCSYDLADTLCAYRINHGIVQYASADDYYEFVDGDSISWRVGIVANDGLTYTVSNPDFYQQVRVLDATAPKVDSLGISYGNRIHSVADSVRGDVSFRVPLSDVTDHVSDNCDDVSALLFQYSLDGVSYEDFNGVDLKLNVYESPSVMVYYAVTDLSRNTMIDSVLYSVERKSFVGEDSFAIVRDTTVCPGSIPFVWHGKTFSSSGVPVVVGAAHLTVYADESYERYDTVFSCDSYVWRDGVEYASSTTEPVFVVHNGEGVCDSIIHLNLTVLNPSLGVDSIIVCVKELPYEWHGSQVSGDTTLNLHNVAGCDSLVDVKVVVLPIATETIYDTACVSYRLNDSVYTESGVYEQVLTSAVTGCDSILTLHLVVYQPTRATLSDTACGSYTLNDSVYTQSGVYEQFLRSSTGCDSILTLNLTILENSYGADTLTVCEGMLPVRWKGRSVTGDTIIRFQNAIGCDSFVSLKVIENPVPVVEITDTACGSYALNEYEYNKSGDYVQLLTSEGSCDSIVKLHLTILEPSSRTIYDTACGPYTLNGQTYTESGVYEQQLTAANGCDSLLFLVLDINPAGDTLITEIANGSYQLNDSVYTRTGLYTQHIKTPNGCDSIVRLDLTILEGIVTEWSDTTCSGGIFWDNSLFNQSGTYLKHYVTASGADSTSILHLTVLPTKYSTIVDTAYSYYILNDSVYTKSGIYVQHLYSSIGCDSVLTLTLKILNLENGTVRDTACSSFVLNDSVYTESGTYVQRLVTPDGRDSMLTLELVIYPSYEIELTETACGSYQLNDSTYTKSGVYVQKLQAVSGCDSVVKLNLTILNVPTSVITDTACGSYVLNDSVYRKSGSYEQRLPSSNGCDSVITLNLIILPAPVTEIFDTVCISYRLNDSVYTETGVYEQRFLAMNGCDSIVRLNLIVLSSPTNEVYDTACVSYTVDGTIYTENSVLQKKVSSPSGCDSIITVHLTILPILKDTIYRTACGTYTLNDSVYTESGEYTQTLISSVGCDSILTLYLTILEPTYGEETVDICENAAFVKWHDYEVSSDTTLTIRNSLGCDSIVTIHLNRLPVLRSEFSDTSCAPYVWYEKEIMESGDYDYKLTSSIGCDSVITLHLTILPSYEVFLLDSAVSYYEWNDMRYDSSGIYTQNLVSSVGCDSIVTIGLTILPPPEKQPEKVNACISYEWQGLTLTESGIYYDLIKTETGEDSIVSIDLTINYPKYNEDTIFYTVCENELPIIWNGYEIHSDTSRVVLTTKAGCDSFIIFRLNVLPIYDTMISVTTCDSFEWHGRYLYDSGLYTDTLQSLLGCDSITRLSLTVKHSSVTKVRRTLCESELPFRWQGYEFYGDTLIVFPSSNGCDSIIDVKLTINKEYNLVFNEVACGDFYWQGKLLTKPGTYVDSFTTSTGCDSVVTLNLVVSHPYYVRLVDTTKAGTIYEKNGFTVEANHIGDYEYEVNLLSQYGCDSVVHLSLFVDGRDIKIRWTCITGGTSVFFGDKNMNRKFCAGDEYYLNYEILNGVPDSFKFFFDSEEIAQGFRNVTGSVKEGETGAITFTVPEGIAPGKYKVNAQMFGEGKSSKVVTVPIRIGYDVRYVMRMWNDVVVCDNSRNEFVSYQWRKNNVDIPGATGQYYCEYPGLDGYYSLHVVTTNNDTMYVCGKYFEPLDVPFSISSYPVYTNRGMVTVYVHGVKDEELAGARMYVYTIDGKLTYWTDIVKKENEVWIRDGRYVCIVVLEDERRASCQFVSRAGELKK